MLKVENIWHAFANKIVLRGVSFALKPSTITGLIGPSGVGKSVLLKILGRVLQPNGGLVEYSFSDPNEVSLMFQEGALFDSLNVFDNVAFPVVSGKVPTFLLSRSKQREVHDRVDTILARVGLSKASAKLPAQLSGGMRRRLSLARALVSKPGILLLDDPTSGLDPVASSVIMDFIGESHKEYRPTTLIVSHDLRRLLPIVENVIAIFDGEVKYDGPVSELSSLKHPIVRRFISCRYDLTP